MGWWTNLDGLRIAFGKDEATHTRVGEYRTYGPLRCVSAIIDLDTLTDASAVISEVAILPAGAMVEKIDVIVLEEPTGTNAVLHVGTLKMDRTAKDIDGLLAGLTEAAMDDAVGILTTFVKGTSSTLGGASGADVGVLAGIHTAPTYLSAEYETAAFTAGRVRIDVYYSHNLALTVDLDGV